MKQTRRTFLATSLAGTAAFSLPSFATDKRDYILATATTGGTYYPVGVALSTLSKVKLEPSTGMSLSAISSAGSDENIRLMAKGEVQFSILQGLFGYYAWTGTGPMEAAGKQNNVRSITMLWQNVEHFVIDSKYKKTGTAADLVALKGERMALGAKNSGSIGSTRTLFAGLGIDIDKDYDLVYSGYTPSAQALANGQVAGVSIPAGVPAGAITQLFAQVGDKETLLSVTPEELQKMDAGRDLWTEYVIPKGTYVSADEDTHTIAQPNFLSVNDDVPEQDVYDLTKAIYENLPFLQSIHPATKAMALEKALSGLPLPLHAGAAKYYQEQGITVPERLIIS